MPKLVPEETWEVAMKRMVDDLKDKVKSRRIFLVAQGFENGPELICLLHDRLTELTAWARAQGFQTIEERVIAKQKADKEAAELAKAEALIAKAQADKDAKFLPVRQPVSGVVSLGKKK